MYAFEHSGFRKAWMPRNGDINKEFGIYENLCCGAEIVIPAGVTFPHCAKHLAIVTEWRNVAQIKRGNSPTGESDQGKDNSAA